MVPKEQFGHIKLDISNSVLPFDKLASTPSSNDGLSEDIEHQIRSLGCELIQLAGKLLKLPQVRRHILEALTDLFKSHFDGKGCASKCSCL